MAKRTFEAFDLDCGDYSSKSIVVEGQGIECFGMVGWCSTDLHISIDNTPDR